MTYLVALAFTLATWLLIAVPPLVFLASAAVWRARGAANIIRGWAIPDALLAYGVTAVGVLSVLPTAIWPHDTGRAMLGLIPLTAAVVIYRHFDQGNRTRRMIAYFVELRTLRALGATQVGHPTTAREVELHLNQTLDSIASQPAATSSKN